MSMSLAASQTGGRRGSTALGSTTRGSTAAGNSIQLPSTLRGYHKFISQAPSFRNVEEEVRVATPRSRERGLLLMSARMYTSSSFDNFLRSLDARRPDSKKILAVMAEIAEVGFLSCSFSVCKKLQSLSLAEVIAVSKYGHQLELPPHLQSSDFFIGLRSRCNRILHKFSSGKLPSRLEVGHELVETLMGRPNILKKFDYKLFEFLATNLRRHLSPLQKDVLICIQMLVTAVNAGHQLKIWDTSRQSSPSLHQKSGMMPLLSVFTSQGKMHSEAIDRLQSLQDIDSMVQWHDEDVERMKLLRLRNRRRMLTEFMSIIRTHVPEACKGPPTWNKRGDGKDKNLNIMKEDELLALEAAEDFNEEQEAASPEQLDNMPQEVKTWSSRRDQLTFDRTSLLSSWRCPASVTYSAPSLPVHTWRLQTCTKLRLPLQLLASTPSSI